MVPVIRCAKPGDAGAILGIYAPYISETYVSFETEVPTTADFTARITGIMKSYPFLVCEEDGGIIGYAYGSGHRERAAYKYSAYIFTPARASAQVFPYVIVYRFTRYRAVLIAVDLP